MKQIAGISLLFLLLFACAGGGKTLPTKTEADTFMAQNTVSGIDSSCLIEGEYRIGMSRHVLEFMYGEPSEISTVREPWGTQTHLLYTKGDDKLFIIEDEVVVGIRQEEN
ncbi:MAG: hypothetical protein ACQEQV_02840 [Fibrobacterota bacterium]